MLSNLLQSHFLQALGNAILHSLWQSLVLLLVYKAIVAVRKELQPAVKHNLSAIFIVLSFGLFAFTFQENYWSGPAGISEGVRLVADDSSAHAFSLINIPTEMSATLSIAYLILLSFLLTRLIYSIVRTLGIHTRQLTPAGEWIDNFTRQVCDSLRIKRTVTVWIGKNIAVPATIGIIKPIILLPAACITNLSPQQLEAIIIHELSHIRRNDFLINLVLVTIETIMFFNPAVFILMKTIREEREHCCDDLVLKNNYEPLHYAKALLAFSRVQAQHQLAMNATSKKQQLLYRIKRITGGDLEKPVHFSLRISLFVMISILFFSVAAIDSQKKPLSPMQSSVLDLPSNNFVTHPNILKPNETGKALAPDLPDQKITTIKAAPVRVNVKKAGSAPQLSTMSLIGNTPIENPVAPNFIPDPEMVAVASEKANAGLGEMLVQLKNFHLPELVIQQQKLLNEKEVQEALKAAAGYKKQAEKQAYQYKVLADSFFIRDFPKEFKAIMMEGKKLKTQRNPGRILISSGGKTYFKFNTEKHLKTADI